MANAFDAANAPEGEPSEVVVGDFIQFKRSDLVADYPPSEYTATYIARITGGGASEIQLTGTNYNSGEAYLFTVTSTESADFVPGYYHWQLEIVRNSDSNRVVVDRGAFTAIVDLDVNNSDPRTHDEIMLTKIQTILEGRADGDVESYSIQGRSLTKIPIKELMEWERHYRQRVERQKKKEDIRLGRKTDSTIKVRFS
jgi:hypothetical protein